MPQPQPVIYPTVHQPPGSLLRLPTQSAHVEEPSADGEKPNSLFISKFSILQEDVFPPLSHLQKTPIFKTKSLPPLPLNNSSQLWIIFLARKKKLTSPNNTFSWRTPNCFLQLLHHQDTNSPRKSRYNTMSALPTWPTLLWFFPSHFHTYLTGRTS